MPQRGEDYSTVCAPEEWQPLMSSPPSDLAPQATSIKNGWRAAGGGVEGGEGAGGAAWHWEGSVIRIMNSERNGNREPSSG